MTWARLADPVPARETAYASAIGAQPRDAFAPFSKQARDQVWIPAVCIGWPAPDPIYTRDTRRSDCYRCVPTLLLSGRSGRDDSHCDQPNATSRVSSGAFPDRCGRTQSRGRFLECVRSHSCATIHADWRIGVRSLR
jgi:hypothetical protein